ncbi:CdaR family protein [Clostridium sp. SHJSY1]|uniref:CdaR family protein n=1 Tax=Clostridium sp. SHJSY1 TaxID=2942483 RepID=UPI002874BCE4|nr:CdaR family protein [Clostridium sp. SHJSY1]MDS0527202.1 CdaR family protein [Clostridium sp. SHJSY1]
MDNGNEKSLVVKLICVLLSFVLWLYISNVENPTRTSDVRGVSVEILNEDTLSNSNLCISPEQTFTVDLKLEGPATEIYSMKKSNFVLKADLGSYALKKGENYIPVQVESYPEGLTIKNVGVLAVKVNIESKKDKEVEVFSQVKTSYKSGVSQTSVDVKPNKVKVSGPESSVDKVSKVALKGERLDISEDINEKFNLIAVDAQGDEVKGVNLSESEGTLAINTGNQKEVPIKATYTGKLSANLTLEGTSLSKNNVSIIGSYDQISSIDSIETEAIDLSSITTNQDIKVKFKLPKGISIASGQNYVVATVKVKSNATTNTTTNENTKTNNIINKTIDGVQVNLSNKKNETLKYETSTISIEVSGSQDVLNSLTASNISATASVADIVEAGQKDVPVTISLVNTDQSVKIVTKPETVKVTVK